MKEFEAAVAARDGTRLSVGLRIPDGDARVPVVFDCHPYRKDDLFSFRGGGVYEHLNERGFATARLDVRGTGRSGGTVPASEYSHLEIEDCLSVIEWLAAQPWSNGRVGMWGISWSAINTLLVAARRPPALGACMAVHPSDELFASDIHYIDGLFHYDLYELSIDLLNSITPGTDFPLDEELLADRFHQPPWMASVLQHQRNDGYWSTRSLAPHWERIACPVFLVGGWYDGYHECVFRLLDRLQVPVEACVGPWSHVLPHMGGPGPAVDWPRQAADWWDRWLREEPAPVSGDTSRDGPPGRKVQLFARRWHAPASPSLTIEGEWRSLDEWPLEDVSPTRLALRSGRLVPELATAAENAVADDSGGEGAASGSVVVASPARLGREVGHWWGDVAEDQAALDAESETFELGPLEEPLEVLGPPVLLLEASAAPGAALFARLCDVSPAGAVTLVTGGAAAIPARAEVIRLPLHWTSWRFEAGHTVRLSLTTALWPMFWPPARSGPVTVSLTGGSHLELPVPPDGWGRTDSTPPPLEGSPGPLGSALRRSPRWEYEATPHGGRLTWATDGSTEIDGGSMSSHQQLVYDVDDGEETGARADGEASITVKKGDRTLTWLVTTRLESGGEEYRYDFERQLREGDALLRRRRWSYRIPRDVP